MKRTILVTFVTILLLLAAAPTAASAQNRCQDTYTVQYGDYLISIAAEYDGVSFLDIARANDLEPPYTLNRGQELCIPEEAGSGSTSSSSGGTTTTVASGNFSLRKQGDRLRVMVEDLQRSETYFVKVDDANKDGLEWFKVGILSTDRDREGQGTYTLPQDLEKATAFNVCLKNVVTDDLICSNPDLTRYTDEEDDDDGDADKATFTVNRLTGARIMINTSRFPKNSFWNVRARVWGGNIQAWSELGKLRTRDDSAGHYIYELPSRLVNEHNLYICLKNQVTNEAKCVGISG